MTKLTDKALRRETGICVHAHGKLRVLIMEAQADFCLLRLKGLQEGYAVAWKDIYELSIATGAHATGAMSKKRQAIVALLNYRDSETGMPWSYSEIGLRVERTRERVRQIAKEELAETGHQRQAQITVIQVAWRKAQRQRRPIRGILAPQIIRSWLQEIGHSYCGVCYSVKPIGDMTKVSKSHHSTRCKACTAARTRKYHRTPEGKANMLRWQADNPEKLKEYVNRYQQSPKGKARIKARREAAQASA